MAMSGLSTTAINWVGTMAIVHGADFARKVGQQNIRIYNLTGRALANLMSAGEVTLSPTIYNSHVAASSDKGAPLGWFAPGPVPVTDTGVAIARKAPHPHAAMLFADFLCRRKARFFIRSSVTIPPPTAGAGARCEALPDNRANYIREYEVGELYQDAFLRRRP